MLNVIMLNVAMLSVIMLNVVAPFLTPLTAFTNVIILLNSKTELSSIHKIHRRIELSVK
jgi:hypothetical protein